MFRSYKLYIQISRNKIKVVDLVSGTEVVQNSIEPFSSDRAVLSKFAPADATLQSILRELGINSLFLSRIKILIQQVEGTGNGLTDIEKRALRDLAENAGANKVFLAEGDRQLTLDEALSRIEGGRA